MYRLNRGLELTGRRAAARRFGEMAFRLFDQWQRPLLELAPREEHTCRRSTLARRRASQWSMRASSPRTSASPALAGEARVRARSLLRQIAAALVNARHVIPAIPKRHKLLQARRQAAAAVHALAEFRIEYLRRVSSSSLAPGAAPSSW